MRRRAFLLLAAGSGCARSGGRSGEPPAAAVLEVAAKPAVADVQRIGVNLGTWTSWGAEQHMTNVIKNPGFEGSLDRAIAIVRTATDRSFTDDNEYLGRPDGFWSGAGFDVRTGPSAGRTGILAGSRWKNAAGLPEYEAAAPLPPLRAGDVVALTRTTDDAVPVNWWFPTESLPHVATVSARRPGSPGCRCLALRPRAGAGVSALSYLDAIGERAGKLLPVTGDWRLTFWSRVTGGEVGLKVAFQRAGSTPMLQRAMGPGRAWVETTIDFAGADDGPAGILSLEFQARGAGEILLDDVTLGPSGPLSPFRRELMEALARLRPGYLRDWQGQLGDTFANRIAPAFARRPSRYRPGGAEETQFFYSLPEFLELCSSAGARPWIIVPPAFCDREFLEFGRYLAAHAGHFDEVLVEFGNENWNPLFRPAGIPAAAAHGEAFDRAFPLIRQGTQGAVRLLAVANGQYANPEAAIEIARGARTADVLAVAPYFLYSVEAAADPETGWRTLFEGDRMGSAVARGAAGVGQRVAVSEVNLHTTGGTAPPAERTRLTAGMASGSALAKRILDSLSLGMTRQCAYVLAGFDTPVTGENGFAPLWGIVRDLGPTLRFRPTGLAIVMLNRLLAGDLYPVETRDQARELTAAVFRNGSNWGAAIVSAAAAAKWVSIVFPASPDASVYPQQAYVLDAPEPDATNEEAEQVRILAGAVKPEKNVVRVQVPRRGLVVLTAAQERV